MCAQDVMETSRPPGVGRRFGKRSQRLKARSIDEADKDQGGVGAWGWGRTRSISRKPRHTGQKDLSAEREIAGYWDCFSPVPDLKHMSFSANPKYQQSIKVIF